MIAEKKAAKGHLQAALRALVRAGHCHLGDVLESSRGGRPPNRRNASSDAVEPAAKAWPASVVLYTVGKNASNPGNERKKP